VLVRVEDELVVGVGIVAAPDQPDVPAGKDPRRRVDILLGVVADAEREELHDLAPEVLLRAQPRVRPAVEPDDDRRVLRHLDEQIAELAKPALAEHLDLSLRARKLAGLERQHLRRQHAANGAVQLAERRREVVVPEERHLLLERPPRVHHPKQPSLPRVLDRDVRRKRAAARRDAGVRGIADLLVHVVGNLLEVEQISGRRQRRHVFDGAQVVRAGAESGTAQQVLDLWQASGHGVCSPAAGPS
jgi:hypothetical protein